MNKDVRLLILREAFKHMGSHSGYDRVCDFLENSGLNPSFVWLKPSWFTHLFTLPLRVLRKLGVVRSPWFKGQNLWAELEIIHKSRNPPSTVHILYGENSLELLLKKSIKGHRKLVVTIHQPVSWWQKRIRSLHTMFNSVDALIVLSRAEQKIFSELTSAKVHFVPHGIDTDFFRPVNSALLESKIARETICCIFVGQWLRDFQTLYEMMSIISEQQLPIQFDIVVPKHAGMASDILSWIEGIEAFPFVSSHQNLTDQQLLELYQNANFLVLPLLESTANNSILESLSCGLPIITTKTSGVQDYVDESCARIYEQGDAAGMVEGIKELSSNSELQKKMASEARDRAVTLFSWECISQQIAGIYWELHNSSYDRTQNEKVAHH